MMKKTQYESILRQGYLCEMLIIKGVSMCILRRNLSFHHFYKTLGFYSPPVICCFLFIVKTTMKNFLLHFKIPVARRKYHTCVNPAENRYLNGNMRRKWQYAWAHINTPKHNFVRIVRKASCDLGIFLEQTVLKIPYRRVIEAVTVRFFA